MSLSQVLLDCQPENESSCKSCTQLQLTPRQPSFSHLSRVASISTEFHNLLHNDTNLVPSFWHEDFSLDHTNFSYFAAAPIPGTNNQDKQLYTLNLSPAHFHTILSLHLHSTSSWNLQILTRFNAYFQ